MIMICGPPWDSCLALEQEMKHQRDRVAGWESFFQLTWQVTGEVWDSPGVAREQQRVFLHNTLPTMRIICIHVLLNIIIVTLSPAVGLENELSNSTSDFIAWLMIWGHVQTSSETLFYRVPSLFLKVPLLQELEINMEMPFQVAN